MEQARKWLSHAPQRYLKGMQMWNSLVVSLVVLGKWLEVIILRDLFQASIYCMKSYTLSILLVLGNKKYKPYPQIAI